MTRGNGSIYSPTAAWKIWMKIGRPGLAGEGWMGTRRIDIPWLISRKFPSYFGMAKETNHFRWFGNRSQMWEGVTSLHTLALITIASKSIRTTASVITICIPGTDGVGVTDTFVINTRFQRTTGISIAGISLTNGGIKWQNQQENAANIQSTLDQNAIKQALPLCTCSGSLSTRGRKDIERHCGSCW